MTAQAVEVPIEGIPLKGKNAVDRDISTEVEAFAEALDSKTQGLLWTLSYLCQMGVNGSLGREDLAWLLNILLGGPNAKE